MTNTAMAAQRALDAELAAIQQRRNDALVNELLFGGTPCRVRYIGDELVLTPVRDWHRRAVVRTPREQCA